VLNWRLFDLTSFTRYSRIEIKVRISKSLVYLFLLSSLVSISGVVNAPKAEAGVLGTIYNVAPVLSGGVTYSEDACATDSVVVGINMGWNPRTNSFVCAPLNADLTISPLSTTWRTSTYVNYALCPDGMSASGLAFINSNGIRAALICQTPPGMSDTAVETQYVSANNTPRLIDKPAGTAYSGGSAMRCTAGDLMVGWRIWSGAWLDGIAPRCAPYQKFNISYNVNGGSGTAPTTQTQSTPNESLTVATYSGTRAGYTNAGWNRHNN
jgi:hypothetical protein